MSPVIHRNLWHWSPGWSVIKLRISITVWPSSEYYPKLLCATRISRWLHDIMCAGPAWTSSMNFSTICVAQNSSFKAFCILSFADQRLKQHDDVTPNIIWFVKSCGIARTPPLTRISSLSGSTYHNKIERLPYSFTIISWLRNLSRTILINLLLIFWHPLAIIFLGHNVGLHGCK